MFIYIFLLAFLAEVTGFSPSSVVFYVFFCFSMLFLSISTSSSAAAAVPAPGSRAADREFFGNGGGQRGCEGLGP